MKKLLWGSGILLALILVFVLGLSLFIKNSLKSEQLKALIIPKVEAFTGRKAQIDQIHVSLFKGIIVRGIHLKEHDGEKDFLAAREFILDYNLFPLLRKEIVIKRIEVLSPSISLRKERDGTYNFSDLTGKERGQKRSPSPGDQGERSFPFTVTTDKIYIRDAIVTFSDDRKELPDMTANADIEMTVLAGKRPEELKASGVLRLKELKTALNGIPVVSSGTVTVDSGAVRLSLETTIGKGTIRTTGTITDYLGSPDISLDISARELDIDSLAAAGGSTPAKADGRTRTTTGKAQKGEGSVPREINAAGEVKVATATLKGYRIKDLSLKYRFAHHGMILEPVQTTFSGGGNVRTEGTLNGGFRFNYIPGGDDALSRAKKSLTGKGTLTLSRCEVIESKITDAIALLTGVEDLKRPRFESGEFDFSVKDQKVFLNGGLSSATVTVGTSGTVGFDERMDIAADLKLSPALAAKLPTARITASMKDGQGWTVIPLKITGTVEKSSVKPNPAALNKQIEQGIREEVGKKLLKDILGK
ncbi:MAG TPA: AsmA family protein [Thermodesulfovibrionales bacterium]|nr:AsmA family protein [Thermodesulfovibrionales bacterium]